MAQHSIDLSIMAHHGCYSYSFQTKPTISIGTFYGGIPICLTTLQLNLLFKGPSNFPFQQTTAIKNNMSINKNFVLKCLYSKNKDVTSCTTPFIASKTISQHLCFRETK